jgi:DNA-binding transcriptional ArsR family regulator
MEKEGNRMKILQEGKRLERFCKGAANHWRIAILLLLNEHSGLTTDQIAEALSGSFKNISQHTGKLVNAGLLNKRHEGASVIHTLSPYGKKFVRLLQSF